MKANWSTVFPDLEPKESVLTAAYTYHPGNYTEVTGPSIITPVIQKSAQQYLTEKLQHPFKLPHLAAYPWLAPF